MSGGVDSSVSAALLKRAGYDVTGVFIQVWQSDWVNCTSKEDRREAMKAAAYLNIPFTTLDLTETYKREVVDYMIREYMSGRTPNPDVMCNRHVKFGDFYKWAMENGADYVATGHYAQIEKVNGHAVLSTSKDSNKDQSYFLWTLNNNQLEKTLFPVGHLEKPQVRKLAEQFRLPNASRKDSQGLCFIGKLDVKDFLRDYVIGAPGSTPGKVLNENGDIIGDHDGSIFYTIGERHGFHIFTKTPTEQPFFVISKDMTKNTITVGHKNTEGLLPNSIQSANLSSVNINGLPLNPGTEQIFDVDTRIRYRSQPIKSKLLVPAGFDVSKVARIDFLDKVTDLAPGQSVVFYIKSGKKTLCIGGGIAN